MLSDAVEFFPQFAFIFGSRFDDGGELVIDDVANAGKCPDADGDAEQHCNHAWDAHAFQSRHRRCKQKRE